MALDFHHTVLERTSFQTPKRFALQDYFDETKWPDLGITGSLSENSTASRLTWVRTTQRTPGAVWMTTSPLLCYVSTADVLTSSELDSRSIQYLTQSLMSIAAHLPEVGRLRSHELVTHLCWQHGKYEVREMLHHDLAIFLAQLGEVVAQTIGVDVQLNNLEPLFRDAFSGQLRSSQAEFHDAEAIYVLDTDCSRRTTCSWGRVFTRNPWGDSVEPIGSCHKGALDFVGMGSFQPDNGLESLRSESSSIFRKVLGLCEEVEDITRDIGLVTFLCEGPIVKLIDIEPLLMGIPWEYGARKTAQGSLSSHAFARLVSPTDILHVPDQLSDREVSLSEWRHQGLPISSGFSIGYARFSVGSGGEDKSDGPAILVTPHRLVVNQLNSAHSIRGVIVGPLGYTHHAAIMMRQLGLPCVSVPNLRVDRVCQLASVKTEDKSIDWIAEGELIAIDGDTGVIHKLPDADSINSVTTLSSQDAKSQQLLADLARVLQRDCTVQVFANADTPHQMARAFDLGAAGIGLCRTENGVQEFAGPHHLQHLMLGARRGRANTPRIDEAIEAVGYQQRVFFERVLEVVDDRPVFLRLLDLTPGEILASAPPDNKQLEALLDVSSNELAELVNLVQQESGMLGVRGVRLLANYGLVYKAQIQALLEAIEAAPKTATSILPNVILPFVCEPSEIVAIRRMMEQIWQAVHPGSPDRSGVLPFKIGAMIETVQAVLKLQQIAPQVDFVAFGLNDLSQLTFGIDRDLSATSLLEPYRTLGILLKDPFEAIDSAGLGKLLKLGISEGRRANPQLIVGLCGEHASHIENAGLISELGVDFISCQPHRIPAMLVALIRQATS